MEDLEKTNPELFGQERDSVLVACPTYSGLSDCLDEYLQAYKDLAWHDRNLMIVDNTDDGGKYAESIKPKVEDAGGTLRRVEPSNDWEDTFNRCWGVILAHASWNGYTWVWSLEQDVIVPKMMLDTLLNVACYIKAPFVTHTYPYHNGKPGFYQGLGCTLMKTELLEGALHYAYKRIPTVEGSIYDVAKRNSHAVLHQLLPVEHRDDKNRHWQFEATTNDEVAIGIES
jgi:hypothetical protein